MLNQINMNKNIHALLCISINLNYVSTQKQLQSCNQLCKLYTKLRKQTT